MTCFHPLTAYQNRLTRSITFNDFHRHTHDHLKLPCGQCIGCRLERSRQWAIRCVHEAQLHKKNCFITLTYNNENLPRDKSLNVRHFQLFMKRLRKKYGDKIRFFHCGEYGEKHRRPHYHACIFNHDFSDKILWKKSNGIPLYTSQSLSELWPYGFSSIGEVTFESAAYVARYIMKKITGEAATDHYEWVDDDGEIHTLKPEYTTMSRRPGIAADWLHKYHTDVYPHDLVVLRGKKMRPPKYYDGLYEHIDPYILEDVKQGRIDNGQRFLDNNTSERLAVREQCQKLAVQKLVRNLD